MQTWMVVALALLMAVVPASAKEPLSPLVVDWEQHFRVDAESTVRGGQAVVSGKVLNISSWGAKKIQLLVEGLDASGQPVDQRVVWLGVDLAAGMHGFFEAKIAPAVSYRVRVFAFDSRRGRWG